MSKKTQLVRLIGNTSIAALISAGSGSAQVIVDPGDTLVVGSGETINDQVILFDGSTIQIEMVARSWTPTVLLCKAL